MVRKLIISITFLMSVISLFGQGNFMFNQHGNQDCQYGNLANYTTLIEGVSSYTSASECGSVTVAVTNLATAKQMIDLARSCYLAGGFVWFWGFCITNELGSTLLKSSSPTPNREPLCELFSPLSFWGVDISYAVGTSIIYHIENGVITYKELY